MRYSRLFLQAQRSLQRSRNLPPTRFLSTTYPRFADSKPQQHANSQAHRDAQTSKPENPHMTNTTSTISNEMPSVGADKAPPELISSADPEFVPKDAVPENTERMTGQTQKGTPESGNNAELGVGEMEGAKFKVEPVRRTGEDPATMKSRLLCPYKHFEDQQSFIAFAVAATEVSTTQLTQDLQIKVGRGERWNLIYFFPPSQPATLTP